MYIFNYYSYFKKLESTQLKFRIPTITRHFVLKKISYRNNKPKKKS